MKIWVIILAAYVSLFLVYIYFFGSRVQPADWMQLMLMTALVGVTIIYAWSTHKQAESSSKAVERMREQTIITSRPVIIQKAVTKPGVKRVKLRANDNTHLLTSEYHSHFVVMNVGHGPAVELEISLIDKDKNSCCAQRETYLKPGEEIVFRDLGLDHRNEGIYYLVCEYKLAFPLETVQKWQQTWLPFKLSKAKNADEFYAISGELNFKEVVGQARITSFPNKPS
ncbi:hypothetical protein ACFLYV_02055 [Chloroflexota bacterium]